MKITQLRQLLFLVVSLFMPATVMGMEDSGIVERAIFFRTHSKHWCSTHSDKGNFWEEREKFKCNCVHLPDDRDTEITSVTFYDKNYQNLGSSNPPSTFKDRWGTQSTPDVVAWAKNKLDKDAKPRAVQYSICQGSFSHYIEFYDRDGNTLFVKKHQSSLTQDLKDEIEHFLDISSLQEQPVASRVRRAPGVDYEIVEDALFVKVHRKGGYCTLYTDKGELQWYREEFECGCRHESYESDSYNEITSATYYDKNYSIVGTFRVPSNLESWRVEDWARKKLDSAAKPKAVRYVIKHRALDNDNIEFYAADGRKILTQDVYRSSTSDGIKSNAEMYIDVSGLSEIVVPQRTPPGITFLQPNKPQQRASGSKVERLKQEPPMSNPKRAVWLGIVCVGAYAMYKGIKKLNNWLFGTEKEILEASSPK